MTPSVRLQIKLRTILTVVLCCCTFWIGWANAQVAAAVDTELRLFREEDRLVLSTNLPLTLAPAVEIALQKGIPIYFVMEAQVTKDRWYWYDKKIAGVTRHIRLGYQPITRKWRVNAGAESAAVTEGGMTLSQTFDRLDDALAAIGRVRGWPILPISELDPGGRHVVAFSFQLDTTALPKPLQIGLIGQSDWAVAFNKSLRLTPEMWR